MGDLKEQLEKWKQSRYRKPMSVALAEVRERHDCSKVHPGKRHQEWIGEEVFDEGRMKDIYTMDQEGKSPKEIAQRLKLKVSTVKSILGEEVISEFSDAQIDSLKRDYAGLQGKTISGINANKLMKIFDKFDKSKPLLIKLLKAKIPFVSMLAQARLISKHGANAAQLAQMRREQLEEKFQDGFAVRYLDPKNGKRFVVPLKTKKDADDKAAQLKRDGAKDITITKHNLNFKEQLDEANIVFKAKAKEGGYFLVLKRDTFGMSGSQDKFIMRHLKGNKVKELGSHPSLDGAKTFGKNKGIYEYIEESSEDQIIKRINTWRQMQKTKVVLFKSRLGGQAPYEIYQKDKLITRKHSLQAAIKYLQTDMEITREEVDLEEVNEGYEGTILAYLKKYADKAYFSYRKLMVKKGSEGVVKTVLTRGVNDRSSLIYSYDLPPIVGVNEGVDADYLASKMNDKQIANIKNVWKNKKATDVTDAVRQMIKRMDIPTQLAIKHADIPHISKLVEIATHGHGPRLTFERLWLKHKRGDKAGN